MIRPKKRYGQHFLQPEWAEKLVAAIEPRREDRFLEIGPGPGALTRRLAPRVAHLTAVEVDRDMVRRLRPALPPNVTVLEADFLDLDLDELLGKEHAVRVAGNLPYNIASPILFRLLDAHVRRSRRSRAAGGGEIRDATLMLQREVADRLEAAPGGKDYGVLSISIQLHADVRRVLSLPPGAFRPAPKVHSTVIRLSFREPAVTLSDPQVFEGMVRSMFTQRRKTLGNALRAFATTRGATAGDALRGAGIDPGRRPETLQLDELARLAEFFTAA